MGSKDDRTKGEKAAWKKGELTEEEAAESGLSKNEANKLRAEEERKAGNPLAPPE